MANKCEGAFFWSIAFSHLCCDTLTRMRPKVSLRSQNLILIHLHKMTRNSAIERVHKHPELSVVKDKAPAKLCRDFEQVDWSCHLLLEKNCKTGILAYYRWQNRKSSWDLRNYKANASNSCQQLLSICKSPYFACNEILWIQGSLPVSTYTRFESEWRQMKQSRIKYKNICCKIHIWNSLDKIPEKLCVHGKQYGSKLTSLLQYFLTNTNRR